MIKKLTLIPFDKKECKGLLPQKAEKQNYKSTAFSEQSNYTTEN